MKKVIFLLLLVFGLLPLFSQETIQLTWNASTDNVGVAGYRVWIDGVAEGTTTDIFYIISLEPGRYDLTVSAFDAAGNESAQSYPLNVTIKDILPPTIPNNLRIDFINHEKLTLEWNESFDNDRVKGYNVYVEDELFSFTSNPYITINNLSEETAYNMSVSAVDRAGNESLKSYPLSALTDAIHQDSLELKIYPNPNYGKFIFVLLNGTIRDNTMIQIISTNGQMIYQRVLPYGITAPYEEELDLVGRVTNGQYIIAVIEQGKRTMYSYFVVSEPKMYNL